MMLQNLTVCPSKIRNYLQVIVRIWGQAGAPLGKPTLLSIVPHSQEHMSEYNISDAVIHCPCGSAYD